MCRLRGMTIRLQYDLHLFSHCTALIVHQLKTGMTNYGRLVFVVGTIHCAALFTRRRHSPQAALLNIVFAAMIHFSPTLQHKVASIYGELYSQQPQGNLNFTLRQKLCEISKCVSQAAGISFLAKLTVSCFPPRSEWQGE